MNGSKKAKPLKKAISSEKGVNIIEYAILMPFIFTFILAVIFLYIFIYHSVYVRNLAEETAESIARQWGYKEIENTEIKTGIYKMTTYDMKEIYWSIKPWKNANKEKNARDYIRQRLENKGILKLYAFKSSYPEKQTPENPEISVKYKPGLISSVCVNIKTAYKVPCSGLMRLIGFKDYIVFNGNAEVKVFDSKDMIYTSDYILQLLMETKVYDMFNRKIALLRDNINKFLGD